MKKKKIFKDYAHFIPLNISTDIPLEISLRIPIDMYIII